MPKSKKIDKSPEQISLEARLAAEFGQRDWHDLIPTSGKNFKEGVHCHLNPICRKVNTPECDASRCQGFASKLRMSQGGGVEESY